ncbi:MAG: DUF4184 family protein [Candidatus Dadabacteria bacterium]|nr:DUF4184 family protein [Candidatus Dadabacteria bacterium]
MPLTPFHAGVVWPLFVRFRDKLHFMCLTFGAMIPDIEVVFLAPVTPELGHARGLMHSYYGALTVDVMLVLVIAYLMVPPLGKLFRRRKGAKWRIFAGKDVFKAPRDVGWAVASACIGTLSHVTLDVFTHTYNPIFYPYWLQRDTNLLLFGDKMLSNMIVYIIMFIIIISMLLIYWTKGGKKRRAGGKPRRRNRA